MKKIKISFSREVAETLGLESAIILELFNQNLLDNSSYDDLVLSINKNANFSVKAASKNNNSKRISNDWMPSHETLEIIDMAKIPSEFLNLKIKEFKIYWIERGQQKNNWNSTFIDFLRREWSKEVNSNKTTPYVLDESWFPDDDVFDILNLSEITRDSALKYLREFILYWKDKGSAFTTWNSKFIDHVKRRYMMDNEIGNNEENKKYSEPGKYTQDFKSRKNDSNWANEINLD